MAFLTNIGNLVLNVVLKDIFHYIKFIEVYQFISNELLNQIFCVIVILIVSRVVPDEWKVFFYSLQLLMY